MVSARLFSAFLTQYSGSPQQGKLSALRLRSDGDQVHDLQSQINERWLPRLDILMAQGDAEQEAFDVDQEHAAQRACNSEIAQLMKAVLR
jgi:hypothetical protein